MKGKESDMKSFDSVDTIPRKEREILPYTLHQRFGSGSGSGSGGSGTFLEQLEAEALLKD